MIEARRLGARTGAFELSDITFTVPTGGYGVVIGPAGCGKTTLLEVLAGILPLRSGQVHFHGRDVSGEPPEVRDVGIVYQHGYLFPHLSVLANLQYGARDQATVFQLIERLGIAELSDRQVNSLSGGERQLISLARTLARRPSVLLLDEPYSALDPRRRTQVRREVRAMHREWGLTTLQVTHDFAEAGLLGDVAILLDRGRLLQAGPPADVFRRPASPYVAEFLGAENVFSGTARVLEESSPDWLEGAVPDIARGNRAVEFRSGPLTLYTVGNVGDGPCHAVVRAEEVVLSTEAQVTSARNHFRGRVMEVAISGALARITVDVDGTSMVAAVTARSAREMGLEEGRVVHCTFKAMAVYLC